MNQEYLSPDTKKIFRKTREIGILENRIKRYWKKLLKISIQVAKEKGIKTIVIENYEDQIDNVLENPEAIQVYKNGEEVNADGLIELSKSISPSLYRRYYKDLRNYKTLSLELKSMVM